MQFGVIQPLFHQLLNSGDKLSADFRQLVRLSPLPVPTFGRMHLENNIKFVKMSDIYPAYEAFFCPISILVLLILSMCQICCLLLLHLFFVFGC